MIIIMTIGDKCDHNDCDHDPTRSPYISHILDIFIGAVKYPILIHTQRMKTSKQDRVPFPPLLQPSQSLRAVRQ